MGQFTAAGGGGVPVSATLVGAVTPTLARITIAAANTEQSYTLPSGTTRYRISMSAASLKVSYTAGASGTNYYSVPRWTYASEDALSVTGLVLYFQSPTAGTVVEIQSWV